MAEDDPGVRGLVRVVLTGAGHEVAVAADGQEVWDGLHRHPPDVLVLDVRMPGPNGLELLDRVRADPHLGTLPVVMLSARAAPHEVLEGLAAGADRYITKPFSPDDLLQAVECNL